MPLLQKFGVSPSYGFKHTPAFAPTSHVKQAWRSKRAPMCKAGGRDDDDDDIPPTATNRLEATIRRKQRQMEAVLTELGVEALEERLKSSVQTPANPPYRLTTLIAESVPQGKCVLVFEMARPSPASTPEDLAKLAKAYVACGADALSVRIDAEDTPEGLKDLWSVSRAVRVPVIAADWMIHPLQIVEAKEAGAAGVLGVINQVNGRGTGVMSSFSAAIGLDAPVEVVNLREVEALARIGVVFYGINISVGLSIAVPGFASDMAHGLLGTLPFGSVSLVGVRSVEEARKARLSGADSLLIKRELLEPYHKAGNLRQLADMLQYVTTGDD